MRSRIACLFVLGFQLLFMVYASSLRAEQRVPERFHRWLQAVGADTSEYPYNYTGRYELARKLAFSGHREMAVDAYTHFLEDHPGNGDALLGRASTYSWMGKYEKAEQDLKKAIELDSAYSDHWYVLGNVYYFTDRISEALDAYNRAIELSPDRSEFYLARARVLLYQGKFERARSDVQKARQLGADPSDVEKWMRRIDRRQNPVVEEEVTPGKWSVSPGYTFTFLEQGRDPWRHYSLSLSRGFPLGSLSIKVNRHRRFGDENHSVSVTGYYSGLWEGAYGSLRYLTSPEHDFLPLNDYRTALFQSIGGGWVVDANYRRLDYNTSEIDLVGGGLTKYYGNWYSHLGLLYSRNNTGETGFSQSLTLRNYYAGNADDYFELSGGIGESTEEFGVGNVRTLESSSYSVSWVKFFTEQYGFSLSYSYNDFEGQVNREAYSISLTRRW